MSIRTIRLRPPQRPTLGDYTLDDLAIELGDDETQLDFRLELGAGLSLFWALPAKRCDRLRLLHVDGAAYHLDAPELVADPFTCDLSLQFEGALGVLGNGRALTAVRLTITARPATYACEFVTRRNDAEELVTRLVWREDDPWLTANATKRVELLDQLLARVEAAPVLDLDAIARAFEEGGRLFDENFLDGAQYERLHTLQAAARSGSPERIRAALKGLKAPPAPPPPHRPQLAPQTIIPGHGGVLAPPSFAPNGHHFVAGDERGALVIHQRSRAWPESARVQTSSPVLGVAWSPDGTRIAVQGRRNLELRSAVDLSVETAAPRSGDGPLGFGAKGAWLAATGRSGLTLHATPGLERRPVALVSNTEALATDPTGCLAFVVDGGATEETAMGAITSREPARIIVIDVERGTERTIDPGGPVRGLVFDRTRGQLFANLFGGDVSIWTPTGELVHRFKPYDVHVRALAVTPRWLVMIPDRPPREATLDVWSPDTFECGASVPIPGGMAPDWVIASPDGHLLLTRELPARGVFGIRTWFLA